MFAIRISQTVLYIGFRTDSRHWSQNYTVKCFGASVIRCTTSEVFSHRAFWEPKLSFSLPSWHFLHFKYYINATYFSNIAFTRAFLYLFVLIYLHQWAWGQHDPFWHSLILELIIFWTDGRAYVPHSRVFWWMIKSRIITCTHWRIQTFGWGAHQCRHSARG